MAELSDQLVEGDTDRRAIGASLFERCIPAFHTRRVRAVDLHFEPAEERHAGGNVGQAEALSCKVGVLRQAAVQCLETARRRAQLNRIGCVMNENSSKIFAMFWRLKLRLQFTGWLQ